MKTKLQIKGLFRNELASQLDGVGEPVFRADQLLQWIYEKKAESFTQMTNLPALLRHKLEDIFYLSAIKSVRTRQGADATDKFLFQLCDGALIETVRIPATPGLTSTNERLTVCVSTQVGCAYACKFCASGLAGVKRNLTAAEIVDQVWQVQKLGGENVSNIVVMGMGEPLANYDNLMRALHILNAPWAFGIGARKITVSTVGLVPEIRRLADEAMQVRLAISLHAATDEVRSRIMPVNKKFPLHELIEACEFYTKVKGRMLTFEYILIENVNDSLDQAEKLMHLARRVHAKVNLIPYNPVEGFLWRRPDRDRCKMFQHILRRAGIAATLRTEKGTDINAACGQLRLQHEKNASSHS